MGADVMFRPKLGVGESISFRANEGPYAGIKYLPIFYDFNAIYQPLGPSRRIVPELQGGLGGVFVVSATLSSNIAMRPYQTTSTS